MRDVEEIIPLKYLFEIAIIYTREITQGGTSLLMWWRVSLRRKGEQRRTNSSEDKINNVQFLENHSGELDQNHFFMSYKIYML